MQFGQPLGESKPAQPVEESPEKKRRRILAKLAKRVGEFDIPSLIRVLQTLGYERSDIRFASNPSTISQPGVIHSVDFLRDPTRAKITLNLGLLGPQSPLPSYFFREMDETGFDGVQFEEFLGYFDHNVLQSFVQNAYPETNPGVFPSWERYKRRELQLLNLRSSSTLQWLMQLVFPDLGVRVEKKEVQRPIETGGIKLGYTQLGGDSVLGRHTNVAVQSRAVVLVADSERAPSGKPWPAEVMERLESTVFPILSSDGVSLEVQLEVEAQETFAQLHAQSYLGYDRVSGTPGEIRRIRLFSGYAPASADPQAINT